MTDDTPKLPYIFIPIVEEEVAKPDPTEDQLLTNQAFDLRIADKNMNGHLSRKEAITALPVIRNMTNFFRQETAKRAVFISFLPMELNPSTEIATPTAVLPQSFILDDRPMFDIETINQATLRTVGLPILPKGVDKLKLSDFCGTESALPCQNLPNGKILVQVTQPSRT